jgi:hypothetical protein
MDKPKLTELRKDIAIICDYLEVDEKRHFEENERPRNHIWRNIKRVKQWLETGK